MKDNNRNRKKEIHKILLYDIVARSVLYLYTKLCKDINMFLNIATFCPVVGQTVLGLLIVFCF